MCAPATRLHKVVEGEEVAAAAGVAYPHTSHCLGSGDIMVSTMGSPDGKVRRAERVQPPAPWAQHPAVLQCVHIKRQAFCVNGIRSRKRARSQPFELCESQTKPAAGDFVAGLNRLSAAYDSGVLLVHCVCCVDQAKGNFLLLDSDLKVKGTWAQKDTAYGYDFW